jgi:Ubiquitin-activating enzyme E1 FCCH domain
MSGTVTVTLTAAGRVNTPPATLNADLISNAESLAPGLTILPAGLIEDISSTDTGALVIIDQAVTETIDSISPFGANPFLLTELGQIYLGQGSTAASPSNTGVFEVFTGTVGFVIAPGFTVSDGTNQYTTADGGVIQTGGSSAPIFFLATQSGSFAVPVNSVTQIVTSVPSGVSLTVTNPLAGTPGGAAQTEGQYRAQVLQAGLVASTGMPNYLKTLLQQVPGVQANLVSVRQQSGGGWEVIVGGTGDPFAIGLAIFQSLFDVSTLVGSTLAVTGITNANPGVVTTNLNHGYTTGQVVQINGAVGITGINGVNLTITVLTETTFSIGVNTTSSGTWTSGGVVTPNFRNVSATINSFPDSYTIPFVVPPMQTVAMTVTWNTSSPNFVSNAGIAQIAQPALAAYINSIPVGAPINLLMLNSTFITAVAPLVAENLLTVLVFSVSINGVVTTPGTGTEIIVGDPESFFSCAASSVTVVEG